MEKPTPSIAVIDDDEHARFIVRYTLEKIGADTRHGIAAYADAATALQGLLPLFARTSPVLVLCDRRMPGIDGEELGRRLRQAAGKAPLCLVLLTAAQPPDDGALALAAGFDRVVVKPSGIGAWRETMAELIRWFHAEVGLDA